MNIDRAVKRPPASRSQTPLARRRFIGRLAEAATGAAFLGGNHLPLMDRAFGADKNRLKVAVVLTEFTYRSHAHVLLENFLEPYLFNEIGRASCREGEYNCAV